MPLVLFGTGKPGPPAEKARGAKEHTNPMHDRATKDAMAQNVEQLLKDVGSMKATIATLEHRLAEALENGAIAIAGSAPEMQDANPARIPSAFI